MLVRTGCIFLFFFMLNVNINIGFCSKMASPDMILVEGGTFRMGSGEIGPPEEEPVHTVILDSFYMGKYEVTQEEWEGVMGDNPSFFKADKQPVSNIDWYDAIKYCNKRSEMEGFAPCYTGNGDDITCNFAADGCRLPSEAEWEFACRGGDKSQNFKFSGSNKVEEVGWNNGNSGYLLQPVGQLKPNELGIYDMSGNVMEWCWDWYDRDYYRNSPAKSPEGPSSGIRRVARGGCVFDPENSLHNAFRNSLKPFRCRAGLGFRLARTVKNDS